MYHQEAKKAAVKEPLKDNPNLQYIVPNKSSVTVLVLFMSDYFYPIYLEYLVG